MPYEIPEIEGLTRDQVFTLINCRSFKQYVVGIEDYRAGKCVFCNPLDKRNRVVEETVHWRMWENPFAMNHTGRHLVLAPKRHVADPWLISHDDFADMYDLFWYAVNKYQIQGGAFAMRFGPPEWNVGSVLHLHANIIVPDQTGAVQVTLAKEPQKIEEAVARMRVFEKLRLGAARESLTADEQKLVEGRL